MANSSHALQDRRIKTGTHLFQPGYMRKGSVGWDDPALLVMTDFMRITPLTIEPTKTIKFANNKMIFCGVRLLLVTDAEGLILGLITSHDILGEKPLKYIKEHGGQRDEILVLDIMTHSDNLTATSYEDIEKATVTDVVALIRNVGRHHIAVTENINGKECIRGLFSQTQVALQLGEDIDFTNRANSFAELGEALSSSYG